VVHCDSRKSTGRVKGAVGGPAGDIGPRQAFFPRTSAWGNLKKALRGDYSESVWDHLAGTVSAPFEAGEHRQIAVKVIDDRGNELMVVKKLEDGK